MNRTSPDRSVRRTPRRLRAALVALVAGLVPVCALAAPTAQADPPPPVPEVAVTLADPAASPDGLAARFGVAVVDSLPSLPGTYLLRAAAGTDLEALATALELDPAVDDATVNRRITSPEATGTARIFGWSAAPASAAGAQYATGLLGLDRLGADRGAGQVVAVLDTGVQLLPAPHPALADALLPGVDLVDGDGTPDDARTGAVDPVTGAVDGLAGHGTHVAGIVRLVAPDARILPVRVLDPAGGASLWNVVKGVVWAVDHGATVVNASLGARGSAGLLKHAVDTAEARGVVVVAAAGNDGRARANFPASAGCAVSVAATDATDAVAPFSTTGDRVTVGAPGVAVTSAHPFSPTGYASWDGTSMAAPFAAGAAALVRAARPDASPAEVSGALERSAVPVAGAAGQFGRLDPVAAVAAARRGLAPAEGCGR